MNDLEIVRIMTCGSVDVGKSTLIGRLLWESGGIYEDQLRSLRKDSVKFGTQGDDIDYALLLDGLDSEREQGITIDVAYRFFSTANRRYIILDCPGHEEYTRNMATAASHADLAILLVSAPSGLQTQTLRHAKIAALLGVKHIMLVINKMDVVNFSESVFDELKSQFKSRVSEWGDLSVTAIPACSLSGDNIIKLSDRMPWYRGKSLLNEIEGTKVSRESNEKPRFPIQWVNRPTADFRGYSGSIASGTIKVGDEVIVASSRKTALVKEIVTFDKSISSASKGAAVTLTLDKELDASRGDVLVTKDDVLITSHHFSATLFWMGQSAGLKGRSFELRLNSQMAHATLTKLSTRLNLEKLTDEACPEIRTNDIVEVEISTHRPLYLTSYNDCREFGSFILIDKMTNETLAAGTVNHHQNRSDHLFPQVHSVNRVQREALNGHRARVIWLTGLSGSGKSTLASALELELHRQGQRTYVLDGDNIRLGLNKDLGFSESERVENIRRIAEVAKLMMDAGLVVITAFISPFAQERKMARELIGTNNFHEIYVSTPIKVCEERDPKGLYSKARTGEIPNFTGVSSPYEAPQSPDLAIDTTNDSITDSVKQILKLIRS